jgi:hypothetical protein
MNNNKASTPQNKINNALKVIDDQLKGFIKDICLDAGVDIDNTYCKTELKDFCYNLYYFDKERRQTVGHSWPMVDFLELCSRPNRIQMEMNVIVRQMIIKLQEINSDETVWV